MQDVMDVDVFRHRESLHGTVDAAGANDRELALVWIHFSTTTRGGEPSCFQRARNSLQGIELNLPFAVITGSVLMTQGTIVATAASRLSAESAYSKGAQGNRSLKSFSR